MFTLIKLTVISLFFFFFFRNSNFLVFRALEILLDFSRIGDLMMLIYSSLRPFGYGKLVSFGDFPCNEFNVLFVEKLLRGSKVGLSKSAANRPFSCGQFKFFNLLNRKKKTISIHLFYFELNSSSSSSF